MTINIIKKKYKLTKSIQNILGLACLSILFLSVGIAQSMAQDWVAVATPINIKSPAVTSPQIKKEEFKDYRIEGPDSILELHIISEYNIHGRMVQYTEYTTDSLGSKALSVLKIIKYDKGGNRVGVMHYNSSNALIWGEEYLFNEEGRKSKLIQTTYEEAAPRSKITNYQYDAIGNILSINTVDSDNQSIAEYKRNYNSSGELISTSAWSYLNSEETDVKPLKRTIQTSYNYDVDGNLKNSETEITEGKMKWKDIRIFENNFVTEWLSYKNGNLLNHYKKNSTHPSSINNGELPPPIPYQELPLEYDDRKRNPLANIKHNSLRTVTVKTNALGDPIKEVVREEQQVIMVTYFYYNEDDNLVRQKKIHKLEDRIDETHFEYDEFKNPLREITSSNGVKIMERVFCYEYYR